MKDLPIPDWPQGEIAGDREQLCQSTVGINIANEWRAFKQTSNLQRLIHLRKDYLLTNLIVGRSIAGLAHDSEGCAVSLSDAINSNSARVGANQQNHALEPFLPARRYEPPTRRENEFSTDNGTTLNLLAIMEGDRSLKIATKFSANDQPAKESTSSDLKTAFPDLLKQLGLAGDAVSLRQLEKGVGDGSIKGASAQVLVALKENFSSLSDLDPPQDKKAERTISKKAIDAFDRLLSGSQTGNLTQAEKQLIAQIDASMQKTNRAAKDTVRTLYADLTNPLASLKPEAIEQAQIGNCYFYGALAAMASANPQAIQDMIKDNKDGTYTVSFPGSKEIKVGAPTDAEIALFPKTGKFGTWVWVMEKAYGEYCMADPTSRTFRRMLGRKDSPMPQEHTEGPSFLDGGLRILTGKQMEHLWSATSDQIHDRLKELFEEKPRRPITADASFNVKTGEGAPVWMHTYSVIDYNAKDRQIILRNPWGSTPPTARGVTDLGGGKFSMNVDLFREYFNRISHPKN